MSLDLSPTSDCFEAFLRLWLWESRPQHLLPLVAPPPLPTINRQVLQDKEEEEEKEEEEKEEEEETTTTLPTINRQVLQAQSYSSTVKVPNQW